MKHASPAALDVLEEMLVRLRTFPALKEQARGTFYLKSRAFLHFHEDRKGLFADVRLGMEFNRFPVNTRAERQVLLRKIRGALSETC